LTFQREKVGNVKNVKNGFFYNNILKHLLQLWNTQANGQSLSHKIPHRM